MYIFTFWHTTTHVIKQIYPYNNIRIVRRSASTSNYAI